MAPCSGADVAATAQQRPAPAAKGKESLLTACTADADAIGLREMPAEAAKKGFGVMGPRHRRGPSSLKLGIQASAVPCTSPQHNLLYDQHVLPTSRRP
mmetsp:Transcript_108970/g.339600  ORF Transcript_108970/g.339600 Transcript_108970/m.339600 type:complete len:98 (-) Transcript_108970:240-533(-)